MRVAICVPVYGDTKASFTLSLGGLLLRTKGALVSHRNGVSTIDLALLFTQSSDLARNRNELVQLAFEHSADYILWLDADHSFPPDALIRLLQHKVEVVGANYLKRKLPLAPTAAAEVDGEWQPIWSKAEASPALERVGRMGLGLCLMDTSVLREIPPPLFAFSADADWKQGHTEDYYFFRKLREAGTHVFVDHALSMEAGHIAEQVLTFPR